MKSNGDNTGKFRVSALSATIAAILLGGGGQVQAQEAVEEIRITGSRVQRTSGFETPVPVTTVSASELSDFQPGNTVSSQLSLLPQFFNNISTQQRSSTAFTTNPGSQVDLRSLGANRTLILLDGKRVVPSEKRGTVNVDIFPTALMRSVDVVTGGASAAYGADAVAGAVNFVLDREFEGVRARVGTGVHEYDLTGKQGEMSFAFGKGLFDDRLHVIGSAEVRRIEEINTDSFDRIDNYDFWGFVRNPAWTTTSPPGVPRQLTKPNVISTITSPTGLIRRSGTSLDNMQFNAAGTGIVPFVLTADACQTGPGCTTSQSGGPLADINEQVFEALRGVAGSEVKTHSSFLGFKFDVNDRLSLTLDGIGGRTEAHDSVHGGSSMPFRGNWNGNIFVNNAFLPDNVRKTMIDNGLQSIEVYKEGALDYMNDIGGTSSSAEIFTQYQVSTGFDYQIPGIEWNLTGSWQHGRSRKLSQRFDKPRIDKVFAAMDAVRHPTTGKIVCNIQLYNPTVEQLQASVVGKFSSTPVNSAITPKQLADPEYLRSQGLPLNYNNLKPLESPIGLDYVAKDCVPINFLGSGNIPPELQQTLVSDKTGEGVVKQDFAEMLLTGDLFEAPAGPVGIALGLTWRNQTVMEQALTGAPGLGVGGKLVSIEDLGPPINVPSLGIRGIPPGFTGGSPNLHAFATVPHIKGQTDVWEWFTELNVPVWEGNMYGQTQRLNVDGAFRRSTYDRSGSHDSWKLGMSFQAIDDLRLRWTLSEDVREPTFTELFDAQATSTIVTDPSFNNTSFQPTQVQGGNPDLNPETGETRSTGVVWQPSFAAWVDGLQVSLDFWQIEMEGRMELLGTQNVVNTCARDGILCNQIQRSPETGFITRIFDSFLNLGQSTVQGQDFELQWQGELDLISDQAETFTVRWLGSYMEELTIKPKSGAVQSLVGSQQAPRFTQVLTANYGIGPWSFQLMNRFVNNTKVNHLWQEGIDIDDNSVSSMNWWNSQIGYTRELDNGAILNLDLNIQNLLNRDPPVIPGATGAQSIGGIYDIYGRRYNLSANYSF